RRQEFYSFVPCICPILRAITVFVVRILESVTCVRINRDVVLLSELIELPLELLNVIGSDTAVLCAENPQDWCIDFLQGCGVSGEVPIIDHIRRQFRLLKRDIERIAATHAPSYRADPILLHITLRL